MNLHDVNRGVHKNKKRKRVGRGPGSGHGKTSGRGHKGQGAQRGWTSHPAFEGGQLPLFRRIPKRGFNNMWADVVVTLNVGTLDKAFESGAEVTADALKAKGFLTVRYDQLKILGGGELKKKLKVSAHQFSKSALEKIQQAGGEAVVVPGPAPVVKNKQKQKRQQA